MANVFQIGSMVGRTFVSVAGEKGAEEMTFTDSAGRWVRFYHDQDCCESVQIEEIVGDTADLAGSPILRAEIVSSDGFRVPEGADSYTWTFYKFATIKGSVTVRWLGESNGYYSERVSVRTSEGEAA